jgi:hypothetical protein
MGAIMHAGLRPLEMGFYDEDESQHAMRVHVFERCAMFLGVEDMKRVAEAEYPEVMDICAANGEMQFGAEPVEARVARRFDLATLANLLATTTASLRPFGMRVSGIAASRPTKPSSGRSRLWQ